MPYFTCIYEHNKTIKYCSFILSLLDNFFSKEEGSNEIILDI